jgi:hypothetical protein
MSNFIDTEMLKSFTEYSKSMDRKEIINELSDLHENNHFCEMIPGQLIHYREMNLPEDSDQSIRCENYRIVISDTYTREDIVFDINLKQLDVRDNKDKSSYFLVLQDESGNFHMVVMGFTQKYIDETTPQQNHVPNNHVPDNHVPDNHVPYNHISEPENNVSENPDYVKRTNFICCDTKECMVNALCDDCKKYYVESPVYFENKLNVVAEFRTMYDICWLKLSKDPEFTFQVIESVYERI